MREQSSSNIKNTHKVFRGGETKVMKKSLVSLLVFALVFTMVAPAFAQVNDIGNSYAKEEIEALIEAGIIGGYEDGTFKPANAITRAEFAKILALSLELEENAAAANVFTDVPAWAKGYVGALVEAELTTGLTATTYGSSQNITREQLATFFVRAFGYEEAAEELDLTPSFNDAANVAPYAKANVAFASEIGFINGLPNGNFDPKGNAQRQAVARLAYEFYFNADEYHAAAEELIQAAQPTLEVTGVKATNLKEVYVDFNQAVNEGSVADANFAVKDADGETVKTTATLSENGTTVVLTINDDKVEALKNQTKYTLTVEKVSTTAGVVVEKTEKEFTAFDRELPEVEKVVVTGPRSFDIVFSEPIKENDGNAGTAIEVKEENSTIGANQSFEGFGTSTISVELYSDMVDGKTYDVTIRNFEDYAGYKNVATIYELAYEKDENAPVATIVKAEQEYVVVKFDKPVSGLTNEHFYHSFSAWESVGIYKKADPKQENAILVSDKVSTVYVYFYEVDADGKELAANRPLPEGKVTFVTRAKVGSNEIKDNWGNKFEEAVFELNIASDKVTPEVQGITVRTEQVIRVTFNKGVKFGNDNIEVLNTDGSKIDGVHPVVSPVSSSTSVYDVNLGKDLSGKSVLVRIKDVEDRTLAGNKLSLYTETLTITDKTAPSVVDVLIDEDGKRNLYVIFDEPVNSTAIAKANYTFLNSSTNKYVTFGGTASFFNDNKVVRLAFGETQWEDVFTKYSTLVVSNVEDVSGNKLTGQSFAVSNFKDKAAYAPAVEKVEATATDKLVVTFTQHLSTVQSGAFEVMGAAPAAMTLSTNSEGKTVATLTSRTKFAHDASNATYSITHKDENGKRLTNNFGLEVPVTTDVTKNVIDKIAPTVDKVYVGAASGSTIIEVVFTKALNKDSFAEVGNNGFSVSGSSNLTSAKLHGTKPDTVVLTGTNFSENTTVSYNGSNITDNSDSKNKLATFNWTKKLEVNASIVPPTPVEAARTALQNAIAVTEADDFTLVADATALLVDYDETTATPEEIALHDALEAFTGKLADAENVLADSTSTVSQLQTAKSDLETAISNLETAIADAL